ncbi:MAG TPA: amino acid--tRNA ligase-related protein, partial [Candidatus Thermoplasmatota archaeon]|nr:amino acid--tRNA ligase-related protein [Candidatus Thermoplasmatota archaeon]
MSFDTVRDVLSGAKTGQAVRLRGWVHRQRASGGKLAFVVLRDGTGTVQCTVKGGVADEESLQQAVRAKLEASVELLEGTVAADARAPGGFEVKVTRFVLHEPGGRPTGDFPLRGEQGTEFELDNRHLWLRSTELSAVFRVKHRLYKAVRDFFDAEGFVEVDPSVITTNACEGGSTLFTFEYFGQTAYLSQSAQMYLEGLIFGLPKVYSITPSFRAEKSRTTKHLTEFHHLEAEYAWWDAEESRVFQERMVTYLAHDVARHCEADLRLLGQDPERLLRIGTYEPGRSLEDTPGKRFPRIDYAEAIAELHRQGFHIPYGEDFGVPHEKALTEGRVNPVFIIDWPARIKAFYMAEKPGTDRVLCSDLLAPDGYGEIIGGSQRSEDVESMERRLLAQTVGEILEEVRGQLTLMLRNMEGAQGKEQVEHMVLECIRSVVEHRFGRQPAIFETSEGRAPKSLTLQQVDPDGGVG